MARVFEITFMCGHLSLPFLPNFTRASDSSQVMDLAEAHVKALT
jgi:hypothetical protein